MQLDRVLTLQHPAHALLPPPSDSFALPLGRHGNRSPPLAPHRSLAWRCRDAHKHQQSAFSRATNSTRAAVALSLLSGGTFAWYSALYGNPLLPEVKAESAADHGLHAPEYPWAHKGMFETFDHAA